MFDVALPLAALFLGQASKREKARAAVRKLGNAGKAAKDENAALRARLARGEEKLARAIEAAKASCTPGAAPKVDEVLHKAAGLVKERDGRWRVVEKKPAKPAPTKQAPTRAHLEPRKPAPTKKPARTSGRSPVEAARALRDYLRVYGSNWGWRGTPSPTIKLAQIDMRGGLKPDGIMGPATRARAKALGVELPYMQDAPAKPAAPTGQTWLQAEAARRERLKKQAEEMRKRRAARAARRRARLAKKPAPTPAPKRTPAEAARALRDYLATPGANWGWQGKPSAVIELAQRDMGGDTGKPGIMGPLTRARARALGVTLPTAPR